MMKRQLGILVLAVGTGVPAGGQSTRDIVPYLIGDRAAEVVLARTAAPPPISDSATVYVLSSTGFTEAVRGTNGFTCVVLRSFFAPVNDPGFWNPRVRSPVCFNPPASTTVLKEQIKRFAWVLAGLEPTEIATQTRHAYASGELPLPAPGAMAYMLSHEQHLNDGENPRWVPHVMFYFGNDLPASTWGAGDNVTTVIDGTGSDTSSAARVLLVPVRHWSNGAPAVPESPTHPARPKN